MQHNVQKNWEHTQGTIEAGGDVPQAREAMPAVGRARGERRFIPGVAEEAATRDTTKSRGHKVLEETLQTMGRNLDPEKQKNRNGQKAKTETRNPMLRRTQCPGPG